ncbi:MAG: DUF3786 domain-containing protein [Candidatus Omnitrophica bacterium]|nr:DUF3786 domain-containing protein [Candidatus Omnitrophota bacterium]
MGYDVAFQNAWDKVSQLTREEKINTAFLADKYEIDTNKRKVFSLSCNAVSPEYISILILHYLIQKLKGLPQIKENWISFQQLAGGKGYYDAFRKRTIDPIIRKYGKSPSSLLDCLERLPGKKIQYSDCSIVLEAFRNVPVMISLWGEDEEFPAEANILFDSSIEDIFSTEDVAVLSGIIAKLV